MNTSSYSILLLFSGLRRFLNRHEFSQAATTRPSSPTVENESIALLKDDDANSSTLPVMPSISQGVANDARFDSSQHENFHHSNAKRKFNVRETARLSFEFGILWVITSLPSNAIKAG